MLSERTFKKTLSLILTVILVFLILVWGRAFYGSMDTYQRGEDLLMTGQLIRAITYFDRSIHWYTPYNPYVEKSAKRLWEIGERAEKEGDLKLALIAYRTIRGGFYAASHFTIPGKDWIEKSEIKIGELLSEERQKKELSHGLKPDLEAIPPNKIIPPPDIFWTVILEIGFLGWIGSVIGFILSKQRDRKGHTRSPFPSYVWIGAGLVFFAFWILGMFMA